jgi:hypothetical protein
MVGDEMPKSELTPQNFRMACRAIGGEPEKHSAGEDTTYRDCKIEDDEMPAKEAQGETRTLTWKDRKTIGTHLSDDPKPKDKATVNVAGRGTGSFMEPKSIRVETPDKNTMKSSEAVGVPARKKIVIEGQNGEVTIKGEPYK